MGNVRCSGEGAEERLIRGNPRKPYDGNEDGWAIGLFIAENGCIWEKGGSWVSAALSYKDGSPDCEGTVVGGLLRPRDDDPGMGMLGEEERPLGGEPEDGNLNWFWCSERIPDMGGRERERLAGRQSIGTRDRDLLIARQSIATSLNGATSQ